MTIERGGGGRRAVACPRIVLIAVVAAAGLLVAPAGTAWVHAAEDLSLTTTATYTLRPDDGLVRVTVDVTARNNKPNSVTAGASGPIVATYYYAGASFGVQPEATRIAATSSGRRLEVTTRERRGYTELQVAFPDNLQYRETLKFRISFDLPGGRPRSDSDIRVNGAFAAFFAWAFGDSGSVRIVIPAGFEADTSGDDLAGSVDDGRTVLSARNVADPASWYAAVIADRENGLTKDRLPIASGESIVVRAWPGDDDWRTEVSDLLTRGLPVLGDLIGLPWPVEGDLVVTEVHTPLLEGYAGLYYPTMDEIEISEDLDALTTLHEASHAWFNGDLFRDRWTNEGLADTYASMALERIGAERAGPEVVSPTGGAAFPLAAWPPPGRIDDAETEARETYGYNASWTLMREIVEDVGEDGMRDVFAAASDGTIAYRGEGEPEKAGGGAPDWRRLLDLLEEVGDGDEVGELFERWVVPTGELPRLEQRAAARQRYGRLVASGGEWLPPLAVRRPMASWSFEAATEQIERSEQLLALRDEIERRAGGLGLTPPEAFEDAYEAAEQDVEAARVAGDEQLEAVTALEAADSALDAPRDPLTTAGLWGEDPAATYALAEAAFEAGDLATAERHARTADDIIDRADDVGRGRVLAGTGVAAVTLLVVGGGAWWVVRQRSATLRANPPAARDEPVPAARGTPPAAPADGPRQPAAEEQGGDAS